MAKKTWSERRGEELEEYNPGGEPVPVPVGNTRPVTPALRRWKQALEAVEIAITGGDSGLAPQRVTEAAEAARNLAEALIGDPARADLSTDALDAAEDGGNETNPLAEEAAYVAERILDWTVQTVTIAADSTPGQRVSIAAKTRALLETYHVVESARFQALAGNFEEGFGELLRALDYLFPASAEWSGQVESGRAGGGSRRNTNTTTERVDEVCALEGAGASRSVAVRRVAKAHNVSEKTVRNNLTSDPRTRRNR